MMRIDYSDICMPKVFCREESIIPVPLPAPPPPPGAVVLIDLYSNEILVLASQITI